MKYSDIGDRLQLAASIGVIIGLILVIYEIRENNRIAENQAAIDMNNLYGQWTTLMADPGIADLIVRSIESPEVLTRTELYQLRGAYHTAIQAFRTNHFLWESGGLRMYAEDTLYNDVELVFSGPVGRRYMLSYVDGSDDPADIIIRKAVSESHPEFYLEILDNMKEDQTNIYPSQFFPLLICADMARH